VRKAPELKFPGSGALLCVGLPVIFYVPWYIGTYE